MFNPHRLTLFGRSLLLIIVELTANAVCWIIAGILFGRNRDTQPVLSLALLAWTLGLRHALDADHISAIDNATRGLISMGQLPVTCGLFFSLGHSTIVIVVNVAIAISSDVYDKIDGVGTVGGIVGSAVSGSFLFVVGLANSIILWRIIKRRRRSEQQNSLEDSESPAFDDPRQNHMFMMRVLGPVITFVNRPWKMYPVGVLFGFGFDTASSIALLAVSALARKGAHGASIAPGEIVLLPLLFTAGMTLIDSCDSVLMLYSYAGFPERGWALFGQASPPALAHASIPLVPATILESEGLDTGTPPREESIRSQASIVAIPYDSNEPAASTHYDSPVNKGAKSPKADENVTVDVLDAEQSRRACELRVKMNVMSSLSIVLTIMSVLVAFSISLITIMGLIGDQCRVCRDAADAPDGGGLAGAWWRGWAKANDNSGYIGAAIVGSFLLVVCGWYGGQSVLAKLRGRRSSLSTNNRDSL